MASGKMGTIYIGSTSDLETRVKQHKAKIFKGFTSEYNVDKLVYYERFARLDNMVKRERQLKGWKRNWKIKLIIQQNPNWECLYDKAFNDAEVI